LLQGDGGPPLRQLDLRANEISDVGATRLAEGIELNNTVTHLFLSDNCVTDQGALALARALYRNRSLTVLTLDGARGAALCAQTAVGAAPPCSAQYCRRPVSHCR